MCGIVGYVGSRRAVPILLEGLSRLEYRGYDSAGIALAKGGQLTLCKKEGRLARLCALLTGGDPGSGTGTAGGGAGDGTGNGVGDGAGCGIGHTRWATHGSPSDANAHPHEDCCGTIAVVHNGIIENHRALRIWLEERGHRFSSETDTEVIPHLIEELYAGDLVSAVSQTTGRLEGSFALAALAAGEPGLIVAARKDSPLVVGLGDGENFLASDIPAVLPYTRKVMILKDGTIAEIRPDDVRLRDFRGEAIENPAEEVAWDVEAAEKGGYPHFMLKEIFEQPKALRNTLSPRLREETDTVDLAEIGLPSQTWRRIQRMTIVACGTAYHAGLVGKHILERTLRIPVEVDVASEFRYRDPLLGPETLVLVISQSGETADTLAALRESRRLGSTVAAITNVVGSSIAREADAVLPTWAGPEIAVASTKAFLTQLAALYLLAIHAGECRGTLGAEEASGLVRSLRLLPDLAARVLAGAGILEGIVRRRLTRPEAFFIGRGLDAAVAYEGALKMKEISYINAQAYAAGELKHGTLALIEPGIPVIALATQNSLFPKMQSNIQEVRARGGIIIAVVQEDLAEGEAGPEIATSKNGGKAGQNTGMEIAAEEIIRIPRVPEILAPVLSTIPLQLLAYYAAVARGCDVDHPRNLAKSVTVE